MSLEIIALTYDGDDLQASDLSLFLNVVTGLNETPEVRGEDVTIPYLTGQVPRPRRAHNRRIILEGFVRGLSVVDQAADRTAYRTLVRYLNTLFDTARMPANLVASLEDGSIATIAARPLNMIVTERVPSEYADLSVELLSVDPNWEYGEVGS